MKTNNAKENHNQHMPTYLRIKMSEYQLLMQAAMMADENRQSKSHPPLKRAERHI